MTSHDNVTDIEWRLREQANEYTTRTGCVASLECEAADTIATLRKQLENARSEALEKAEAAVVGTNADGDRDALSAYHKCVAAIRALKGQPC